MTTRSPSPSKAAYENHSDQAINSLIINWETPETHEEAARRAHQLSVHYQTPIQFSPPNKEGRVRFCCVTQYSKIGLIKGSVERNEKPLETIQREILEEIGIIIPEHRFIPTPYHMPRMSIFWVPVTKKEVNWMERRIKERSEQLMGEVFDVRFRTMEEIRTTSFSMNSVTKYICNHIQPYRWPHPKTEFDFRPSSPRHTQSHEPMPLIPLQDPWQFGTIRESLLMVH